MKMKERKKMNSIEQMRWAKELISENTIGFMELTVGNIHDDLFIRASDKAMVGLYLSVLPNMKTQTSMSVIPLVSTFSQ